MPPPATDVWQRVADFPPRGDEVRSIAAGGPGFVAVGVGPRRGVDCGEGGNGRIWSSVDGLTWTEATVVELADVSMARVVATDSALYAFGYVSRADCETDIALLKSADGTNWEKLDFNLPLDYIELWAAVGDRVIVSGEWSDLDGSYGSGAWTSIDGSSWQSVNGDPPYGAVFELTHSSAVGDLIVLANSWGTSLAWYSTDAGRSWRRSDFGPLQLVDVMGVAVHHGRIVVAGSACCSLLDAQTGVTYVSTDGNSWQTSQPFARDPDGIVAVQDGFMTIGEEVWLSTDGITWTLGPQLSGYRERWETMTASGTAGVLVANEDATWVATPGSISASSGSGTPEPAPMPEIGDRYRYEIDMWCGWIPIWLGLRTWLPDPPLPEDGIPPGFPDQDGKTEGWLTLVSENELVYESRRDPTLTMRPSDEPVEYGPCA